MLPCRDAGGSSEGEVLEPSLEDGGEDDEASVGAGGDDEDPDHGV
jgi:hypothetical protein